MTLDPTRSLSIPRTLLWLKDCVLDMPINEGSGSILHDRSIFQAHGAIVGASWSPDGKSLDFDPLIPSYVEIPAAYTHLNFTTQAFSIITRFKVDDISTERVLCSRGVYNTDGWWFRIEVTGHLRVWTFQSGANQATSSAAGSIAINTWYTGGFSRNGAGVKIYINGASDGVGTGHVNPTTADRTFNIGLGAGAYPRPYDGKIEFLQVFNRALPAEEHERAHRALLAGEGVLHLGGRLASQRTLAPVR